MQTTSCPQLPPNGSLSPIHSAQQPEISLSHLILSLSSLKLYRSLNHPEFTLDFPSRSDSCYILRVTLSPSWCTMLQLHLTTLIPRVCISFLTPNFWRLFPPSGILLRTDTDFLFIYPHFGWLTPTGPLTSTEMPLPLGRPLTPFWLLGEDFKMTWPLVYRLDPSNWRPLTPSPVLRMCVMPAFPAPSIQHQYISILVKFTWRN